ncbi:hypothetical protein [Spirosoma gilvum]
MTRFEKITLLAQALQGNTARLRQLKQKWLTEPLTKDDLRTMSDKMLTLLFQSGVGIDRRLLIDDQLIHLRKLEAQQWGEEYVDPASLTDEELDQQITELEAKIALLEDDSTEKTAEDIALDNEIAWLKARIYS